MVLALMLAMGSVAISNSYAAKIKSTSLTPSNTPAKKTNFMVLGDSLGDGVWAGLYHAFRKNKNIKVLRKSKPSTGFVRLDFYDWNANLEQILTTTKISVAVIMVGANDRQTIVTKAGRYKPGSKRWREIYASRVDTFIRQLKDHGAKVYWVGLPITRRKKYSRHMKILNEIFAERARANNIIFVDIWKDFTTSKGRYSAHGKDIKGRVRKLRANDGVHFTMRGYQKLALAAERYIRADFINDDSPVIVASIVRKKVTPERKKIKLPRKPPVVAHAIKPVIKKPVQKKKITPVAVGRLMMGPELIEGMEIQHQPSPEKITEPAKIEQVVQLPKFTPKPKFTSAGSETEKVENLKLALNILARRLVPEQMGIHKEAPNTPIIVSALPKFQANADYLAKNLQKNEKTGIGKAIQQALANDFQDILSIVQPDKAVVVSGKTVDAPLQEARLRKKTAPPQRQQTVKTATMSVRSDLPWQSEKAKVASRDTRSVRPVSVESGTPDGNVEYADEVEYARKTPREQDAFTGTSALASIASISGLDIATISDAEGILTTIVYRTLLRGDAVSPKAGRGDDFSWPRD